MMFRSLSFFALCFATISTSFAQEASEMIAQAADEMIVQEADEMNIPEGKEFISEEFLSFEETVARVREHGNSNLRRGLQNSPACRAQSPLNKLRPEGQYCSALAPYPCGCAGIAETSCYYCAIRPDVGGITCQVSGSLITFRDHLNEVVTCGCEYLGNGQRSQFCYKDVGPVPIPPPAIVTEPAVAPVAPRAPFAPSLPAAPAPTPAASNGSGKGGKGKGSKRI